MSESARESAKKPESTKEDRTLQTRKSDSSQSLNSSVDHILFLQRTIGNQAVGRLIKSGALQTKLKVSEPGDIYEQEADRVANQVMRMTCDLGDEECEKKRKLEEEEKIQRKAFRASDHEVPNGVRPHADKAVSAASTSTGQPLPSNLHRKFEYALGVDLSAVRVHTGPQSVEANKAISARAYTTGSDIHFNEGQYNPESTEGQQLLAHEVVHTVQQRGIGVGVRQDKFEVRYPSDSHGVKAESIARSLVADGGLEVMQVAAGMVSRAVVHRQPAPGPQGETGAKSAVFSPLTVKPGDLGKDKPRTPELLFRGDFIEINADFDGDAQDSQVEVAGRALAEGEQPTIFWPSPRYLSVSLPVGNMGVIGKIGEAPLPVDMYVRVTTASGKKFEKSYTFKVIADMAWLSGQCNTAALRLNSAFLGLSSTIDQAFLNYDEAYQLHKTAVDNHGKRKQLERDILLGILLAGIGGGVGGKVADILKRQGVAVATATGDITKYIIRLGGVRGPSGSGQQGSDTPNPTVSPGTARAAGVTPERWKALKEKECNDAAKAGVDACLNLKKAMDEAWAQGKTASMDVDPIQIVEPTVQSLQSNVDVETTMDYLIELWRTWLRTYGITATPNWAGGKTRTDETRGWTAFTDSDLFDDIHAQVGSALDDEVARLRTETAPDPLTEMPD